MKNVSWFEWGLLLAMLAVMFIVGFAWRANSTEFKRVCEEARGTTVWDGRQYQCIGGAK